MAATTLKYVAGQYCNLLERALSITLSPVEDSLFPSEHLYDGRPQRPCKHGSNAAAPYIKADLAAFTPRGAGTETFAVRAGERRHVVASGGTVAVSIKNLTTGYYLTTGGAWQISSTNCLTSAGSLNYQVESLDTCQSPTVNLELTVTSGSSVTDWPRWNAGVIFGHNLDRIPTYTLRSSSDNFSASNNQEAAGSIAQPSFWMEASATVDYRYAGLFFGGTNTDIPWYGQAVICYLEDASFNSLYGYEIQQVEQQIRHTGDLGTVYVHNLSPHPRRIGKFEFDLDVAAEAEMRQEIVWRCRGGAYPIIIVPDDTDSLVMFGRLDNSWRAQRSFLSLWSSDLIVSEEPVASPLV